MIFYLKILHNIQGRGKWVKLDSDFFLFMKTLSKKLPDPKQSYIFDELFDTFMLTSVMLSARMVLKKIYIQRLFLDTVLFNNIAEVNINVSKST